MPRTASRNGVVPVSALGVHVRYSDGSERLCMNSGLWNVPFGYGNDEIVERVHEVSARASYLLQPNIYAVEAAEAIVEVLGRKYSNVLFATSGGAAVDLAMKLCRLYGFVAGGKEKRVIVGLTESYHGLLYGSFALTAEKLDQSDYAVDRHSIRHIKINDASGLDDILEREGSKICGIFIEPIQGNNGEIASDAFLGKVTEAARRLDFLVVADEVATGVYRTGPVTASSLWASPPDAVILSKGLTNGMVAASAIAVGERAVETLARNDRRLVHLETQAGTPTSCVAMTQALTVGRRLSDGGDIDRAAAALHHVLDDVVASVGSIRVHGAGSFQFLSPDGDGGRLLERGPEGMTEDLYEAGVLCHPTLRGLSIVPAFICSDSDRAALKSALIGVLR